MVPLNDSDAIVKALNFKALLNFCSEPTRAITEWFILAKTSSFFINYSPWIRHGRLNTTISLSSNCSSFSILDNKEDESSVFIV